jgi:hypothetical protein
MTQEPYLERAELPDGRVAIVTPGLFVWLLKVGRAGADVDAMVGWSDIYTYEAGSIATAALDAWVKTGSSEPAGWVRHQPSNRRRPDGDPTREHVRA